MLTLKQMQDRLSEMTYKDWKLRIYEGAFEGLKFEVDATVPDSTKPGETTRLHIISPIDGFLTLDQFDYYIAKRLIRIETHECMEELKVNGVPLFNPHREDANQDKL